MGISAYTRDKVPLEDICTCDSVACTCFADFAEYINPDWTAHYWCDAEEFVARERKFSTPEEWNSTVDQWRRDAGI